MLKNVIRLLLLILFLGFSFFNTKGLLTDIRNTSNIVSVEPKNKSFFTDEMEFLKKYYLMKNGVGYYQASLEAEKNNAAEEGVDKTWKQDFWGHRLPFIFYFWKLFTKNGAGIIDLFIIMSFLLLLSSYLITKKFVNRNLALLSPLILVPYLLNALRSTSFLFVEWWAMFFFVYGLASFYYRRFYLATLFFSLTVLTREHFIIPLSVMLIISILFNKPKKSVFSIPLLVFFIQIIIHAKIICSLININNSIGIIERLSFINKNKVLTTLAFSTNSYLLVDIRPSLIWLSCSLLGLSYLLIKAKNNYYTLIALATFLPLFISFFFMGNSIWEDYWGAMYVPVTAIFSPLIFRILSTVNLSKYK